MKVQVWLNKESNGPDYIVLQKQRTMPKDWISDGSSYRTIQVGEGYARSAPDGEIYIDVRISGLTDNTSEYGRAKE